MTDKEKIRAEIERLLNKEWSLSDSTEAKYRNEAYKELLEFIDSDTEEPVSEDLEEAAEKHALQCHSKKASVATLAASIYDFRAGANWQKEQLIDKTCEWLLNNIRYYSTNALGAEYMCNDFRKAMED